MSLTRGQAADLVMSCANLSELLDLQQHWIGHRDYERRQVESTAADDVRSMLLEYVDACAFNGDDTRSNGPKDSDHTELEEP